QRRLMVVRRVRLVVWCLGCFGRRLGRFRRVGPFCQLWFPGRGGGGRPDVFCQGVVRHGGGVFLVMAEASFFSGGVVLSSSSFWTRDAHVRGDDVAVDEIEARLLLTWTSLWWGIVN